jgi:hypothetical protein
VAKKTARHLSAGLKSLPYLSYNRKQPAKQPVIHFPFCASAPSVAKKLSPSFIQPKDLKFARRL